MTAAFDLATKRAEIEEIRARRSDVIAQHPSTVSRRALVERQQVLGGLVKLISEGWIDLDDTDVLPLIVDVLLRNCPQASTAPEIVARSVQEAADVYGAQEDDASYGEAAAIVAQLAAGTAHTATYAYLMQDCQALADWLTAAASR